MDKQGKKGKLKKKVNKAMEHTSFILHLVDRWLVAFCVSVIVLWLDCFPVLIIPPSSEEASGQGRGSGQREKVNLESCQWLRAASPKLAGPTASFLKKHLGGQDGGGGSGGRSGYVHADMHAQEAGERTLVCHFDALSDWARPVPLAYSLCSFTCQAKPCSSRPFNTFSWLLPTELIFFKLLVMILVLFDAAALPDVLMATVCFYSDFIAVLVYLCVCGEREREIERGGGLY